MNRKQKIIRNTILLIGFSFLLFTRSYLYLDPMTAFRASERSNHYGPSEVVYMESFPGGKYIVGRYEQWISQSEINQVFGIFWRIGNAYTGIEIKENQPLTYVWSQSDYGFHAYGIITDSKIAKIEVYTSDGSILTQSDFHEGFFILSWEEDAEFRKIMAYDASGAVIFEEERLR